MYVAICTRLMYDLPHRRSLLSGSVFFCPDVFWSFNVCVIPKETTCRFTAVTLSRLIQRREWCHAIQHVPKETGSVLFIFVETEQWHWWYNDAWSRQFYIPARTHSGEPVVKEQEACFVKCSFKSSDSVVQKQRIFSTTLCTYYESASWTKKCWVLEK